MIKLGRPARFHAEIIHAHDVVLAWLEAEFEGGGRHARRVGIIDRMDALVCSSVPTDKMILSAQSPWYDDIIDELIVSGRLKELVEEYGVRGFTSNPSIFN